MTAGHNQSCINGLVSKGVTEDIGNTLVAPRFKRHAPAIGQVEIKVPGYQNFPAPAILAIPAHGLQELASRHHGIRQAVPEISSAIAIGIHRSEERRVGKECKSGWWREQ